MNSRERFLEVMNFNKDVHSLKWEFGLWGETVNNWYDQGLPLKSYWASLRETWEEKPIFQVTWIRG